LSFGLFPLNPKTFQKKFNIFLQMG
jgi:hypothetical protein